MDPITYLFTVKKMMANTMPSYYQEYLSVDNILLWWDARLHALLNVAEALGPLVNVRNGFFS